MNRVTALALRTLYLHPERLTVGELKVVGRVACGDTYREIAYALLISLATVGRFVARAAAKADLDTVGGSGGDAEETLVPRF